MTARLLVVGGDAGGMAAASTARRRVSADDLEVVAFERGAYTSYSACGIPYFVGGLIETSDDLIARSPEEHRARGIDVRTRHEVVSIDTGLRQVTVRDLASGSEVVEPYDSLVIATGATPVRPVIPGIGSDGVFGVQTLADGIAVHDAVTRDGARRAVVVGGGYVGLEMVEALIRRGLEVTVIDAGEQPMTGALDPDVGALVADAMCNLGATLHLDERVHAIHASTTGSVERVETDARAVAADLVVLGLGVRPDVDLAAAAGIEIGVTGGIRTDDRMRTSAPGVWAAGDCVEVYHRVSRRPTRIALGTHANKQGRVAGIVASGGDAAFPGVVGTAVTRICEYEIGRTGLTEREAATAGLEFGSATIEGTSKASYLADAHPIRVKVVFEPPDGRLLGAQVFGREGAAKRVDVLAVCLWNEMTVGEIEMVDLGYAPSVAPVWDPLLVAAQRAVADLARRPE